MAFKLKVKKGTSAPASGALDSGELGYNTNSSIFYVGNGTGNAATEVITNSSTAQTKVGAFVTQGKLGGEFLELETLTGSSPTTGQLTYETDSGTFRAGIFGNYVLDLGEKQVFFVENVTGSTIAKGTVVGFSGAAGDHLRVAPYIADSSANIQYLMGIADQSIANSGFGFVVIIGKVRNIDTSAYAPGTILYVSAANAGQLTSTKPTAPNRRFAIGAVVKQNASSGILQVRTEAGVLLDDVHDVAITSVANGNLLTYDGAKWINSNTINGNITLSGTPTTTNQNRGLYFTGFDKETIGDTSDAAFIRHTVNIGGHSGSVLELSSQNDSTDGIALTTNASSQIRHNGHVMWDANNDGAGSGLDADLLDGNQASAFVLKAGDTMTGGLTTISLNLDGQSLQDTATVTTTSTTQTVLATYAVATYATGKFMIQATSGGNRHISELLVTHNGTVSTATEYGILKTAGDLFTVTTDISGGNVRILVTSASATSTVYRTSFTLIGA
jgi:hypothetical protein